MTTWRPILDELFASPTALNKEKLALWARVFGAVYEHELKSIDEWRGLSGKRYRVVARPGRVLSAASKRVLTTDFVVADEDRYFAVEAKCQPWANPRTVDGSVAHVLAFGRGASSTAKTFRTLLLEVGLGLSVDTVARILTHADNQAAKGKGAPERWSTALMDASKAADRPPTREAYFIQTDVGRLPLSGVCLVLPRPHATCQRAWESFGVSDVFSIHELLAGVTKAGQQLDWLQAFAARDDA